MNLRRKASSPCLLSPPFSPVVAGIFLLYYCMMKNVIDIKHLLLDKIEHDVAIKLSKNCNLCPDSKRKITRVQYSVYLRILDNMVYEKYGIRQKPL